LSREIYARYNSRNPDASMACQAAVSLSAALACNELMDEAISLLRHKLPVARRCLGRDDRVVLKMTECLASNILLVADEAGMTREDLDECEALYKHVLKTMRQVLGTAHPDTQRIQGKLDVVVKIRETERPGFQFDRDRVSRLLEEFAEREPR